MDVATCEDHVENHALPFDGHILEPQFRLQNKLLELFFPTLHLLPKTDGILRCEHDNYEDNDICTASRA